MWLNNRNAIIYGGAGAIGSVVATALADAGARAHLVGRTRTSLDAVAEKIRADGGAAEVATVDALDETAVDEHADAVAATFGSVDISINLIDVQDVQGTPLVEMTLADFEQPISIALRSSFLTGRAAARHMIRQGSGVILTFGGDGGGNPIRDYSIGGFQIALNAADALRRQWAAELGRYGVRVVGIHTGGLLETVPKDFPGRDGIEQSIVGPTLLKRAATLEDVGNIAVFAASDLAGSMSGTSFNITCGAVVD